MKLKTKKTTTSEVDVEVTLPFYYKLTKGDIFGEVNRIYQKNGKLRKTSLFTTFYNTVNFVDSTVDDDFSLPENIKEISEQLFQEKYTEVLSLISKI